MEQKCNDQQTSRCEQCGQEFVLKQQEQLCCQSICRVRHDGSTPDDSPDPDFVAADIDSEEFSRPLEGNSPVNTEMPALFDKYKLTLKQVAFLCAYIETFGVVVRAARACGINPGLPYRWLKNSENFRDAFEVAKGIAKAMLLDEATRRAALGVEEPVFYKGQVCGFIKRYSDSLMLALLKAKFPEDFKDRHETDAKAQIDLRGLDPGRDKLPDDKLKRLLEIAEAIDNGTLEIAASVEVTSSETENGSE